MRRRALLARAQARGSRNLANSPSRPVAVVKVLPTFLAKVQADCVEELEDYLKRAKAGEFTGLAMAATLMSGYTSTTFTRCLDQGLLIGAVTSLNYRLCERMMR